MDTHTNGDCFEAAARWVLYRDTDALLVHGWCTGRGAIAGLRFMHAWVERDGMVIDPSQGRVRVMRRPHYYQMGNVRNTYTYTAAQLREQILQSEHWGPWKGVHDEVEGEAKPRGMGDSLSQG